MHSTDEESINLLPMYILVECSYLSFFFTTGYITTLYSMVQAHTFTCIHNNGTAFKCMSIFDFY